MNISYRSYLTAGVAAVGAGAIALSPIQPVQNQVSLAHQPAIANLAVNLAAQVDPIALWQQVIQDAQANLAQVQAFKESRPLPLLTTIQANLQTYAANPDPQFILDSIRNNINTFFYAPWSPGPCATTPCGDPAFYQGINISNVPITNKVPFLGSLSTRQLYTLLPAVLPAEQAAGLAPLLALAGNTWSGQLASVIGMFGGPVVQLGRSFNAIQAALAQGDTATALNELVNIPALTTNAFLNGIGPVDLTDLVNKIMPLPPEIQKIGLNMGGFLSPPVKYEGTLDNPTALSAGTLFDNLDVTAQASIDPLGTITVTTPGQQVGFYSAAVGLGQYLATQMLVPPPPPPPPGEATPAPTAAVKAAAAVEAPAAVEATTVVDEAAVADITAEVEAPAPEVVSAPAPSAKATAGGDNDGNSGGGRTHRSGARGN